MGKRIGTQKIGFLTLTVISISLFIAPPLLARGMNHKPAQNGYRDTAHTDATYRSFLPLVVGPTPGVWISLSEIAQLPTSGPAWEAVLEDAENDFGMANVSNQDSDHDVHTMAGALVCARTGQYCAKSLEGLKAAVGTEIGEGSRWLAVGRNMTAYTITADILGANGTLTGQDMEDVTNWLTNFLIRTLPDNNSGEPQKFISFASGSNASAQEGAVYAAIAAYLEENAPQIKHPRTGRTIKGTDHLDRVWDAFRRYACDQSAPDNEDISIHDDSGWAFYDPTSMKKCAVNPMDASKTVFGYPGFSEYPTKMRIDGALVNDMDRGCDSIWQPCHTNYPWVGLEGFVPAAAILQRAGYAAVNSFSRSSKAYCEIAAAAVFPLQTSTVELSIKLTSELH